MGHGFDKLLPVASHETDEVFYCRNPEQFGDGTALFVIEEHRPTYYVEGTLPGFSNADMMDVVGTMLNKAWGSHLDVKGTAVTNPAKANLLVVCTRLDGRGLVLGDCELPRKGVFQQRMRLDVSEDLVLAVNAPPGKQDLQAIVNHEGGHFLGYQHWAVGAPKELMEPAIQRGLRDPQPTEIAWGVKLIGAAIPDESPPPVPTDEHRVTFASGGLSGEFIVTPSDKACRVSAVIKRGGLIVDLSGSEDFHR
jgi:hypothetical protein